MVTTNYFTAKMSFALLASSILSYACGSSHTPQVSTTRSVEIPQTPIENQNKVGFCWAYATVALMESNYKKTTGQDINLSEETLGFYRMAQGAYEATQSKSGAEILALLLPGGNEGYWILDEGPDHKGAFALVETYGVMPESAWKFKFTDDKTARKLQQAVLKNLVTLVVKRLQEGKQPNSITMDDIIQKVMIAKNAYPSEPPHTFTWNDHDITPQEFVHQVLGFDPNGYESIAADSPRAYETLVSRLKETLALGHSAILAFPVNFDRMANGGTFSGKGVDLNQGENFYRDGAHAVLVTDFVNTGSHEGALPNDDLLREVSRSPEDLDYIVFKNSWGLNAGANEAGSRVRGSANGYYRMDQDYIRGSLNAVVTGGHPPELMSIIVPKNP